MAQQQMQMQQMQMQQMQQMQQWQQMHQLQQMQSMVGGPMIGGPMVGGPMVGGPMVGGPMVGGPMVGGPAMARGVHVVRYQAIPSRASFAQPRMMRPQMSMMARKKEISQYYYLIKCCFVFVA